MGKTLKGKLIQETTLKQKRGVNNMLSGKFPSKAKALEAAGYSHTIAHKPQGFIRSAGVQNYLKKLNIESKRLFDGKGIEDKVIEVYTEGLGATKLFGKKGIEHPDWLARKAFADKIGGLLGMGTEDKGGDQNQYNFFMFKPQEKEEFNQAFGGFVKNYFKKPKT